MRARRDLSLASRRVHLFLGCIISFRSTLCCSNLILLLRSGHFSIGRLKCTSVHGDIASKSYDSVSICIVSSARL